MTLAWVNPSLRAGDDPEDTPSGGTRLRSTLSTLSGGKRTLQVGGTGAFPKFSQAKFSALRDRFLSGRTTSSMPRTGSSDNASGTRAGMTNPSTWSPLPSRGGSNTEEQPAPEEASLVVEEVAPLQDSALARVVAWVKENKVLALVLGAGGGYAAYWYYTTHVKKPRGR